MHLDFCLRNMRLIKTNKMQNHEKKFPIFLIQIHEPFILTILKA